MKPIKNTPNSPTTELNEPCYITEVKQASTIKAQEWRLFPYLTLAGTLPFIFCALLLMTNISSLAGLLPIFGNHTTIEVLKLYGIVIASFMAGSHWGMHLNLDKRTSIRWSYYLPIVSNLLTIGLWLALLTLNDALFLLMLILSFVLMLILDGYLYKARMIQSDYFGIRCCATAIVVISLALSISTI